MPIYSFTPNPTLDLGGEIEQFLANEKNYVHRETRNPGGNGINAGRILHRLNAPVILTGFIGGGVGAEVQSLLRQEKLEQRWISVDGDTRIGVTVSLANKPEQIRLSYPGPIIKNKDVSSVEKQIENLKQDDFFILGGSFPPGLKINKAKHWLKICRKKSVPTIVDCPGPILKELIQEKPMLIKPNLVEFQQLVGKKVSTISQVIQAARPITRLVDYVCVSSVEGGTLLLSPEGIWFGKIPKIKIRSVVGAGDSMVGAMTARLWHREFGGENLLTWGLAASAATLQHTGTKLGSASEIAALKKQIKVKRLG